MAETCSPNSNDTLVADSGIGKLLPCGLGNHRLPTAIGMKRKKDNCDAWLRGLKFLVADFGLARKFQRGHLIRDGYVAGTNQYMAPEMIGGAYDERADVWSLGVLLHVILTGNFPSHIRKAHSQLSGPSKSGDLLVCMMEMCPDELDLGAPMYSQLTEGARSLLAGMLRKKPDHRFTLSEHFLESSGFALPWHGVLTLCGSCDL